MVRPNADGPRRRASVTSSSSRSETLVGVTTVRSCDAKLRAYRPHAHHSAAAAAAVSSTTSAADSLRMQKKSAASISALGVSSVSSSSAVGAANALPSHAACSSMRKPTSSRHRAAPVPEEVMCGVLPLTHVWKAERRRKRELREFVNDLRRPETCAVPLERYLDTHRDVVRRLGCGLIPVASAAGATGTVENMTWEELLCAQVEAECRLKALERMFTVDDETGVVGRQVHGVDAV